MNAHTPGPWIARGEQVVAHRPHVCGGYNEESVMSLTRSPAERMANAALIASAPELLAENERQKSYILQLEARIAELEKQDARRDSNS